MKTYTLYRGDSWTHAWRILDEDKNPIDLTTSTARVHLRNFDGDLLIEASLNNGYIELSYDGYIYLNVPYIETLLDPDIYIFDLELTLSDGTRLTCEQAKLKIIEDITHD